MTAAQPPEQKVDLDAVYPVAGGKAAWQAIQADPRGYLDLRALYRGDISAYAVTHVYSPKEQKVRLLCGSAGALRVWINGKLIHEHLAPRPARPDADQVSVTLAAGWNPVLIRVSSAAKEHGLYLHIADGDGLRMSARPDAK
jgi:hypothetical protein